MNVFEFITTDQIDELPEDPQAAFLSFVRHADNRLLVRSQELKPNNEDDWHLLEDARYGFTNIVMAAAKRYDIEPFASQNVPHHTKFTTEDYRQFRADLDHYMTQMLLDNSIRAKRDSVPIATTAKDKIRTYVHALKGAIDSSNFSDSKRAQLLDIVAEFERELDKRRLSLLAVTRLTFTILAVPGSVWASYEVATKLTTNILQVVGEAKATEEQSRQIPPTEPPRALLPPRPQQLLEGGSQNLFTNRDLDDEIPF